MPVNFKVTPAADLKPIEGIRIGIASAGIKKVGRKDITVFLLDAGTTVGAVFTENRFCAAPVQIGKQRLAEKQAIRALVVNTGNANAGTGAEGLADAHTVCQALAKDLQIDEQAVLPFSTGVIMEPLPVAKIVAALPSAIADAKADNWALAAEAIMTTDTVPKALSKTIQIGGKTIQITGISKGAGMIRPNMATMLGYLATDAAVDADLMPELAKRLADVSFNCISIDGDTSTNDSFVVMATGKAGNMKITDLNSAEGSALLAVMGEVATGLAQAIVRDGEGATKFIAIRVSGGKDEVECKKVAYAIAHSPLVKTAFFASDPNLGRILAAVGYAGILDLDQSKINLSLGDVLVAENGGRASSYREEDGQRVMQESEITVRVELGRGSASAHVWTCDLSHDYVSINADYRS